MDRSLPQLHQNVHEVLANWPETARAFRSLKTACIGCYLARFCTLVDVAATYHLPIETVMDEMQNAARNSKTLRVIGNCRGKTFLVHGTDGKHG